MLLVSIFLGFFFFIGFALLSYGLLQAKRSMAAAQWPTVPGKVDAVEMVEGSDGDSGTTYRVRATYSYSVGGREYQGDRIAYGYTGSSNHHSELEILNRLKECRSVDVRYDPFEPDQSVLSYGIHKAIRFMLLFSTIWLLFISGFALMWWIGTGSDTILLQNLSTH